MLNYFCEALYMGSIGCQLCISLSRLVLYRSMVQSCLKRKMVQKRRVKYHKQLKPLSRHSTKESLFGLKKVDSHIRLLLYMTWCSIKKITFLTWTYTWNDNKAFQWIWMSKVCHFYHIWFMSSQWALNNDLQHFILLKQFFLIIGKAFNARIIPKIPLNSSEILWIKDSSANA